MRARKKAVWAALLGAGALLLYLCEPFSSRFEGRTARQWLNFYTQTRRLPERAVVRAFGDSAIPMLVEESRPGGLFTLSLALERLAPNRFLEDFRSGDFDRRLACHDWARLLRDTQPDAYTRALSGQTDLEYGLELTRLFYGDRYLGATLKKYSAQTTNQMLQAKAEALLDAYRSLN